MYRIGSELHEVSNGLVGLTDPNGRGLYLGDYIHMYICIYIYIYRERERDR